MELDCVHEGDNLAVMQAMPADSVDLVYMDPPFNTGSDFKAGADADVQFSDRFADIGDYVEFMRPRVQECRRLLKPKGAFYLHCDWRADAYLRVMADGIFGIKNFLNQIIWRRTRISHLHKHSRAYGRVTDTILLYADRVDKAAVASSLTDEHIEKNYPLADSRGRYMSVALTCDGLKKLGAGSKKFEFMGHSRYWQYSEANMRKLLAEDRIILPKKPGGLPRRKCYAHEHTGVYPTNLWDDLPPIEAGSKERVDYPTQKPLALLHRIVGASSADGGVVLDPFCGSGTALVAAKQLGRRYVGIDRNPEALRIAEARLAAVDEAADAEPAAHPLFAPKQP